MLFNDIIHKECKNIGLIDDTEHRCLNAKYRCIKYSNVVRDVFAT